MRFSRSARRTARRLGAEFRERYLLSLLAIALSGGLLAIYFGFNVASIAGGLWTNIIASGVFSCWAFVLVYVALRMQGILVPSMDGPDTGTLVGFYAHHDEVDWKNVIRSSKRIDIVVHYYNRWVRENFEGFVEFFGRGGQLRLIMADPRMPEAMQVVHEQFFANLTENQLLERIAQTEEELRRAFDEASCEKASVKVYYFPQALHYSVVRINERHLYLSTYEQFRGPVIRSSVFHLDLVKDPGLEAYWDNTMDAFIQGARLGYASPEREAASHGT